MSDGRATFSLINVNPKFTHRIVESIKLQGLAARVASVDQMRVERPGVFDLAFGDDEAKAEIVRQFAECARRSLQQGAEVLVPAGGSLMAVLADAGVHQIASAPVLNGLIAVVKVAELAVAMRQLTGQFTSKHLIYGPRSGKLLADIREAYGAGLSGSRITEEMPMRLKEKVAIVTGSASGIGKAIAQRFANEGAFVIIADKNEGAIPPTVDEIKAAGGGAAGFPVDVADRRRVHAFMTEVVTSRGRLDILVNNAGITRYRPFLTMSDEDWNLVLDVDLKGVFVCVQAAAPQMIRQAYGKIVNISSALGTGTTPHNTAGSPAGSSAYASAKAGVIQLQRRSPASSARTASM